MRFFPDRHGTGLLAAVAVTLALTGVARADGMPERTPSDGPALTYVAPARVAPWTGFYIGAHAGYGWTHTDVQSTAAPMGHVDGDGPGVGGHAGFNWQHYRYVIGAEVDGTATWLDSPRGSCSSAGFNCSTGFNWLASVRGRAGVVLDDQVTLLYLTAGGAWTEVDYTIKTTAGAPAGGFSAQHTGWVAGGGVEYVLHRHLVGRLEYLYYGFDDASVLAGNRSAVPATVTPAAQIVRLGVSVKF